MLTEEQTASLARMREDAQAAGAPFCAFGHWENVAKEFDIWFEQHGIELVEEQPYNSHFASYPPTYYIYFHFACCVLYRLLCTRDKWGILDKIHSTLPAGSPRKSVIEGHEFSWDALISAESLISIIEVCPALLEPRFVLADLGAGWGRIGAAFKQVNPQGTYVVFDLPEALLLSSTYLPTVLPDTTFHFYDEMQEMETITRTMLQDGACWMMGAHCLNKIQRDALDCIINIASLKEMSLEYQRLYWDIFETVAASGIVYNLQHDTGGQIYRTDWEKLFHRHVGWSGEYYEEAFRLWT